MPMLVLVAHHVHYQMLICAVQYEHTCAACRVRVLNWIQDWVAGAYIALHALQRLEQAAASPQAAESAARQPRVLKVRHRRH